MFELPGCAELMIEDVAYVGAGRARVELGGRCTHVLDVRRHARRGWHVARVAPVRDCE